MTKFYGSSFFSYFFSADVVIEVAAATHHAILADASKQKERSQVTYHLERGEKECKKIEAVDVVSALATTAAGLSSY